MRLPRWLAVGVLTVLSAFAVLGIPGVAEPQTYEAEELRLLELINEYRQQNGLEPLLLSAPLSVAAERHSEDMGNYGFFSHTTENSSYYPIGADHSTRIAQEGYDYNTSTGENLAYGQATAEEVFSAWQASPSHNSTMLGDYRVIGIGLVWVDGTPYWTTEFGAYVDPSASTSDSRSDQPAPRQRTADPSAGERPAEQDRRAAKEDRRSREQPPRSSAANEQYRDESAAREQYAQEADALRQPGTADQINRDTDAAADAQYDDRSRVTAGPRANAPSETRDASPRTGVAQPETAGVETGQKAADGEPAGQEESTEGTAASGKEHRAEQASRQDAAQSDNPSDTASALGITMLPDTGGAPLGALLVGGLLVSAGLAARRTFR